MTTEKKESILDKIQKLMNKAASCTEIGNAEEAQAFMGKVQSLMNKHRLEMSDVEAFDPENEDSSIDEEMSSFDKDSGLSSKKRIWWQNRLAQLIAFNNNCKILVQSGSNNIWFVGRKRDRQICIYLWTFIVRTMQEYARKEYDRLYARHYAEGTQSELLGWKKSFFNGFIAGVVTQYGEIRDSFKKEVGKDRFALVTTSQLVVVEDWMKGKYGKGTGLNGSHSNNSDGYSSGVEQGMNVNLSSNAVNSSSTAPKQLK